MYQKAAGDFLPLTPLWAGNSSPGCRHLLLSLDCALGVGRAVSHDPSLPLANQH
ncbi:MAG: hypothetical protein KME26_17435 [Oscillatoria princeps RMCB-10]|nr:hypothetical protein [Oscillatoria princeps RMCB-10]